MSVNAQISKFATANAATGRRDSLGIRMENKRVVTTPKSVPMFEIGNDGKSVK